MKPIKRKNANKKCMDKMKRKLNKFKLRKSLSKKMCLDSCLLSAPSNSLRGYAREGFSTMQWRQRNNNM